MRQLAMFCIGGAIGFVVDAGLLRVFVSLFGWNAYAARFLSFLCAATATWLFNRNHTFRGPRHYGLVGEWARYVFAMCGGFAVNYAIYAALYYHVELVKHVPELGVGAGSLGGMVVNYLSSRWWIYRHRPAVSEAVSEGRPEA